MLLNAIHEVFFSFLTTVKLRVLTRVTRAVLLFKMAKKVPTKKMVWGIESEGPE
jgi:hypothetical protein